LGHVSSLCALRALSVKARPSIGVIIAAKWSTAKRSNICAPKPNRRERLLAWFRLRPPLEPDHAATSHYLRKIANMRERAPYLIVIAIAAVVSIPIYPYRWHLWMHIFGAVSFLGNIIVTAGWMTAANRTADVRVVAFASRMVARADWLFTAPSILLILINGSVLAGELYGWANLQDQAWITSAFVLFALSGVIWGGILAALSASHDSTLGRGCRGRSGDTEPTAQSDRSLVDVGRHRDAAPAVVALPHGRPPRALELTYSLSKISTSADWSASPLAMVSFSTAMI
jgi:uncharacterized membrane protein